MSAIRRTGQRTSARVAHSSPYARPAPPKKSSWSLTGLLSFLNPLRSRSSEETQYQSSSSSSESLSDQEPSRDRVPEAAQSLSARGRQIADDLSTHGRPNAFAEPSSQQPFPRSQSQQTRSALPTLPQPVTPARPNALPTLLDTSSPAKNLETVSAFLSERGGRPISDVEVEGLISLIQKSTPPADKPEPFRFTSSTPSTPARGNSPNLFNASNDIFSFTTPSTTSQIPISSARKTLTRNPNGVYRWEGGGSAKPRTKNRYSSPAFGASPSTNERIVLKDTKASEPPRADTKRRRVGEEAESSTSTPTGSSATNGHSGHIAKNTTYRSPAPDPSPMRVAQAQAHPFPTTPGPPTPSGATPSPTAKLNGVKSPTRLRVPALPQKPTQPAIPSPLRQAWSGGSSGSQTETTPPQAQRQRQTKAANFMADLIKEVTPPKRPDVSNPYQTASPVGKVGGIAAKPRPKRVRATGKPTAPAPKEGQDTEVVAQEKAKEKEYSPQAIIEATVPKGSKRSRPPVHLEKKKSPSATPDESLSPPPEQNSLYPSRRSPRGRPAELPQEEPKKASSYTIEEVNDEDDEGARRGAKKLKSSMSGLGPAPATRNGRTPTSVSPIPDIVIEEVDDVDMQPTIKGTVEGPAKSPPLKNPSMRPPHTFTSAPREPSKLRQVYQPASPAPLPPMQLGFSPAYTMTPSAPIPVPVAETEDKMDTSLMSTAVVVDHDDKSLTLEPKDAAIAMASRALPAFTFSVTSISYDTLPTEQATALKKAQSLPKADLPVFDFSIQAVAGSSKAATAAPAVKTFDWSAAGMKAPSSGSTQTSWTCSTCSLSNPATAIDKCTICDAPKSASVSAPTSKGFDFAAAGMKAPSTGSGTSWNCSMCGLSNPASVVDKCTICEAARPAITSAPPSKSFDWAAAGIKQPVVSGTTWPCSTCGLSNPASATDKCTVCDTPR